jgi:hypothetical protein
MHEPRDTQGPTGETLLELERALLAEQAAVARLDVARLADLTAEKGRLAAAVREALAGTPDPALQAQLHRVKLLATANAALLAAASEAMAEALGVHRPLGTYDGRARMRGASRSLAERVL